MRLTTILVGGVVYFVADNLVDIKVRLRTAELAGAVTKVRTRTAGIVADVKDRLRSRAAREEALARQDAQRLYDSTIQMVFETGTPEEKQALIDIFQKYSPSKP